MRIVGLDPSLRATGVALPDGSTRTISSSAAGIERCIEIAGEVCRLAAGADLVVLEGYSYASGHQAHQIGELGGVLRAELFTLNFRWVEVAPALLKKFATGKGNANKEQVFGAAIRQLHFRGDSFDEADALWLRSMGRTAYDEAPELSPLSAVRREVLAKIEWPAFAPTRRTTV